MARLSSLLLVRALILFASALANEIEHLASPMTHLAPNDHLYTTIHTYVQRFKRVYFSGKAVGKFEKMGDSGSYRGNFRGTMSAKKTKARFGFKVRGFCKSIGFNVKYRGKMSGKMSVRGKHVAVLAG